MSRAARIKVARPALRLVQATQEASPPAPIESFDRPDRPDFRVLEYFATLTFELPNDGAWALHPASEHHIREQLDGRYPLISRGIQRMYVTYAVEGAGEEHMLQAEQMRDEIAQAVGIASCGMQDVEIDRREPVQVPAQR